MKKKNMIQKNFRLTKEQDKFIKSQVRKYGGEGLFIRRLIDDRMTQDKDLKV